MKKILLTVSAGLVIAILAVILIANRPGDASQSCQGFYAGMEDPRCVQPCLQRRDLVVEPLQLLAALLQVFSD
jgi:hypothetical protein